MDVCTRSESDTVAFGATLASWLQPGDVVLLHGDLGTGKTVLAKGIARGLQIDVPVTSPSFALVNEYAAPAAEPVSHLYHLDLYRLDTLDELETIGFSDIVNAPTAVILVEWPERAFGALPERYLLVELTSLGEDKRQLAISAAPVDDAWHMRLADLGRLVRRPIGGGEEQ